MSFKNIKSLFREPKRLFQLFTYFINSILLILGGLIDKSKFIYYLKLQVMVGFYPRLKM